MQTCVSMCAYTSIYEEIQKNHHFTQALHTGLNPIEMLQCGETTYHGDGSETIQIRHLIHYQIDKCTYYYVFNILYLHVHLQKKRTRDWTCLAICTFSQLGYLYTVYNMVLLWHLVIAVYL